MAATATHPTINLAFKGLPPSPNQTAGKHWTALYKDKQDWQGRVAYESFNYRPTERFKTAHVHFHISTGDNRRHDPDNLNWAVTKPALDGLKTYVLSDDSIDNVTLSYSYDRSKPRGFTITVEPR